MAPTGLQTHHIQDLSGGLNIKSDDSLIASSEGSEVTNFTFNSDGSLTKRSGSSKYNASTISASKEVHSLYRYYQADETKKFLCIVDSALYEGNDGAGTWASKGGVGGNDKASWVTWQDDVYFANNVGLIKKYDGTTLSTVANSPTTCKYIVYRKDRLYAAGDTSNPSRLYFCDTGDPTTWDIGTNFIDINADDGDIITGILPLGDWLVIYKRNSVYLLAGTSLLDFFVQVASLDVGCISPKSLASFEGRHYFLDKNGVYVFDSGNFVNISNKIQSDTINRGISLDEIPSAEIENVYGAVYKRQYLMAYASTGQATNNKIFTFDITLGAWALWDGLNASAIALWNGTGDAGEIYFGDYNGFVWQADTGDDDGGEEIACRFKSKYFDLEGSPLQLKRSDYVSLIASQAEVSPSLVLDFDWGAESQSFIFQVDLDIAKWDDALWDIDIWAGGGIKKLLAQTEFVDNKNAKGQTVSFDIQESSSVNWRLIGYGALYKVLSIDETVRAITS